MCVCESGSDWVFVPAIVRVNECVCVCLRERERERVESEKHRWIQMCSACMCVCSCWRHTHTYKFIEATLKSNFISWLPCQNKEAHSNKLLDEVTFFLYWEAQSPINPSQSGKFSGKAVLAVGLSVWISVDYTHSCWLTDWRLYNKRKKFCFCFYFCFAFSSRKLSQAKNGGSRVCKIKNA